MASQTQLGGAGDAEKALSAPSWEAGSARRPEGIMAGLSEGVARSRTRAISATLRIVPVSQSGHDRSEFDATSSS